MFNHIISALDAAIVSSKKKNFPNMRLNYSATNKSGVGGVQVTYTW